MPEIEVRRVALPETRRLRREVLRPYMSLEELAAHEPPGAVAFGAFADGDLVAVGLVGAEGEPGDWRVRGMATRSDARGRGAGTAILQALVQHAVAHGATRVWCNARTPALTLYERVGFVVASDEFEPPRIGPHYRMELSVAGAGDPVAGEPVAGAADPLAAKLPAPAEPPPPPPDH
jgi:GNAT superfamily N-acetyltransferase